MYRLTFSILPQTPLWNPTAKEHLCAQQHAHGSRQRHQEEEAYQVRFHPRNGPQVLAKPKVLQEVQQVQAGC